MWVRFVFPDLSMLAGAGKIPDHLRAIALVRIAKELKLLLEPGTDLPEGAEPTIDDAVLAENTVLNHWVVTQMVREVSNDGEEWAKVELQVDGEGLLDPPLPSEDVIMLLDFAERLRVTDARGVVMGVTPLSAYARFLHAHREHGLCGADCPGCEELRNEGARGFVPAGAGAV